ncbi:hypothetical protein VTH06DRAFT_7276 [Thermothelomyces fergusii]
MSVVRQK